MTGRRELDKEEMFRKIMPSSRTAAEDAGTPDSFEEAGDFGMPAEADTAAPAQEISAAAPPEKSEALAGGPAVRDAADMPRQVEYSFDETGPAGSEKPEANRPAQGTEQMPGTALDIAGAEREDEAVLPAEAAVSGPQSSAASFGVSDVMPEHFYAESAEIPNDEALNFPVSEQELGQALSGFAASVNSREEAPAPDEAYPEPVNLAEILVNRLYPRYLQRLDGCECQRCKDDVCGMALNKIKPRYIASDRLTEEDLNDRPLLSEVVTALVKALFIVKRSPHHDDLPSVRK